MLDAGGLWGETRFVRAARFLLCVILLVCSSCCDDENTFRLVVVSLHGASATDIHSVVRECAEAYGYPLFLGDNWRKDSGDAVAGDGDAARIRDTINDLVAGNGGSKSNLSLLVVGKSAGGVLAWNTFKRHYNGVEGFSRVALVMIDPHGSVTHDGKTGPYNRYQDLWWPDGWSSDPAVLRVYNIYQHEKALTGAGFPDSRVYRNTRLSGGGVDHSSITGHERTRELIIEALAFAWSGE